MSCDDFALKVDTGGAADASMTVDVATTGGALITLRTYDPSCAASDPTATCYGATVHQHDQMDNPADGMWTIRIVCGDDLTDTARATEMCPPGGTYKATAHLYHNPDLRRPEHAMRRAGLMPRI